MYLFMHEHSRTLNAFSRPLPVRENPDALIRGVSSTPVLEGDARSLAVALGYSEYVVVAGFMIMDSLMLVRP